MIKNKYKATDADGRVFSWNVMPEYNHFTGQWYVRMGTVRSRLQFVDHVDPPRYPEKTLESI